MKRTTCCVVSRARQTIVKTMFIPSYFAKYQKHTHFTTKMCVFLMIFKFTRVNGRENIWRRTWQTYR